MQTEIEQNQEVNITTHTKATRDSQTRDTLTSLRNEALVSFQKIGFPTTKHEDWRYTNVLPLVKNGFEPFTAKTEVNGELHLDTIERLKANRLMFIDGWFSERYSEIIDDREHLIISPLSRELQKETTVTSLLGRQSGLKNDGFTAWNTANFQDGAFISIPENVVLEHPVLLYHISTGATAGKVSAPRNLLVAGKNSQSSLIVCYQNLTGEKSVTSTVTEVFVMENARVEHVKIQSRTKGYSHIGDVFVNQQANSRYHAWAITLGGDLIRNNLTVRLDGEGCETRLYGLYALSGNDHCDNHVTVEHAKPNCYSNQLYKGILNGNAHGVFCGRIVVRQDAQKTNAFQSNKNILLSEQATINSKPQLEIFADDVKCTHGATSGQIDEDALFYIRSRGISEQHAKNILHHAFAWEVIEKIQDAELRNFLDYLLMIALNR